MVSMYQDGLASCAAQEQRKSFLTAPGDLHPATLEHGVERRPILTLHCGLSTVESKGRCSTHGILVAGMSLDARRNRKVQRKAAEALNSPHPARPCRCVESRCKRALSARLAVMTMDEHGFEGFDCCGTVRR
jgi:hypothetical protein